MPPPPILAHAAEQPSPAPLHLAHDSSSGAAARASQLAREWFATPPAPALSLAVASGCGPIWAEAMGQADIERGVAASTAHSFQLGSVSKVLTATIAARLACRGAIDLDAPIAELLPDLPPHHRATNLRQLLTHRGGVRHYLPRELDIRAQGGPVHMRTYASNAEILALFIEHPLVASPGRQVHYSSYGYTLASVAMEAATGVDFCRLVETEIARPFKLASLVADDPWRIVPDRAARYMNRFDVAMLYGGIALEARPALTDGFANMPLSNPAHCWAGAGFLMNPSDCALFGAAMLEGPGARITEAERALMFTPMTERTAQSPALGLGWRVDEDHAGRLRWHHQGATPGGRYSLVIYPDLDLSVAIAGNVMTMTLDVGKASAELAELFAEA